MSDKRKRVAVIGAGIFGCAAGVTLADAGYEVILLERLSDIILGTSKNNTNRVHEGFHYPRDLETAITCRDSFERFLSAFPETMLMDFPNMYCIAKENSLTSAEDFCNFCDTLRLSYLITELSAFPVAIRGCVFGLLCNEGICDHDVLRTSFTARIGQRSNIQVICNTEVVAIERKNSKYELQTQKTKINTLFDAVVNCSYANINKLTIQLGHEVSTQQYEYTVVPIIDLDLPPIGVTIMDGPFMTLLPYGKTGKFTLYHVCHSVVATELNTKLNQTWLSPDKSPFASMDKQAHFEKMLRDCSFFVPALEKANLVAFLEAPRMVLPYHEEDDARPTILKDYGHGYLTLFSGKIDRCLAIADSVRNKLDHYFMEL